MKSPGSGGKTTGSKGGKTGGKFPSKKALRREYKGEARREEASARREEADASHRRAEAAHYEQEAAKAEREGYKKEAEYDLAKARREQAEARHDMAKARRNQAKAARNQHKAAHVGLAIPGAIADGWILGGNDWHQGCAAVALANSLLMATGLRASDRDVLDLYWLTADDPDTGAGILATLEAAAEYGLGGYRPTFALCGLPAADGEFVGLPDLVVHADVADPARGLHEPASELAGEGTRHARHAMPLQDHRLVRVDLLDLGPDLAGPRPGGEELPVVGHAEPDGVGHPLIVDLRLQQAQRRQPAWDASPSPDWGAHAGVLAGDKVITWGTEVPVTGVFLAQRVAGAWAVEWSGPGS